MYLEAIDPEFLSTDILKEIDGIIDCVFIVQDVLITWKILRLKC